MARACLGEVLASRCALHRLANDALAHGACRPGWQCRSTLCWNRLLQPVFHYMQVSGKPSLAVLRVVLSLTACSKCTWCLLLYR